MSDLDDLIEAAVARHAEAVNLTVATVRIAVVREIVEHLSTTGAPSQRGIRKRIAREIAEGWGK